MDREVSAAGWCVASGMLCLATLFGLFWWQACSDWADGKEEIHALRNEAVLRGEARWTITPFGEAIWAWNQTSPEDTQ